MTEKIGIVLVNYGNYAERFLAACRDSLRRQDYGADNFRVYIVDNASTPASRAYLQAVYPEAIILERADGNYAAANNLGIARAANDGCPAAVVANMDTEMDAGWLSALVRGLEDNPGAGIIQSKIMLYPDAGQSPPLVNSLGNRLHFLGFGFTSGYREADRRLEGYPEISGYASGCSFIIRCSVWEQIGGYDEAYYMYHDDVEIGLKTRLAGWRIALAPASVVYHKYEFSRSIRMFYYMEKNRYRLLLTFYPLGLLLLLLPALVFLEGGLIFYALLGGRAGAKFKAIAFALRPSSWREISARRRQLKALARIPFLELARTFAGRLDFVEINNPVLKYVANPILGLYWRLVKLII